MVRPSTPRAVRHGRAGFSNVVLPDVSGDCNVLRSGSGGTMGVTRRSCPEAQTANRRELAVERAAKKDAVEALNGLFKTTSVAVVAHYSGLTVAQMQKLRMQMKQAGASVKVSKNRLAKIALEGTDVVAIGTLLKGPTVIATSNDPVAAPKVAIEFAKTNEQFVILGGSVGKTSLAHNNCTRAARLTSALSYKDGFTIIQPSDALNEVVRIADYVGTYTYKLGYGLPEGQMIGYAADRLARRGPTRRG